MWPLDKHFGSIHSGGLYFELLGRMWTVAQVNEDLARPGDEEQSVGYTSKRFLRCSSGVALEGISSQGS
jgi:hypothetical protein